MASSEDVQRRRGSSMFMAPTEVDPEKERFHFGKDKIINPEAARMAEAKRLAEDVPQLREEAAKKEEVLQRRRRSLAILESLDALRKPLETGGVATPRRYRATDDVGIDALIEKRRRGAKPIRFVNIAAPFDRTKGSMSSSSSLPAIKSRSLRSTNQAASSAYGTKIDLRDSSAVYHLIQKERSSQAARRQLELLKTRGLPYYYDAPPPSRPSGVPRVMTAPSPYDWSRYSSLANEGFSPQASTAGRATTSPGRLPRAGVDAGVSGFSTGTHHSTTRLRTGVFAHPIADPDTDGLAQEASEDPSYLAATERQFATAIVGSPKAPAMGRRPTTRDFHSAIAPQLSTFQGLDASLSRALPAPVSSVCISRLEGVDKEEVAGINLASSVGLAHLNSSVREQGTRMRKSYEDYAVRALEFRPHKVQFGMIKEGCEYCVPVSIKNVSLVRCRFRVGTANVSKKSSKARLRCRYPSVRMAPGLKVELLVLVTGIEPGDLMGNISVTTERGTHDIPVEAKVLPADAFKTAIQRYTRPGTEPEDPLFAEFIVPNGGTHRDVVPVVVS